MTTLPPPPPPSTQTGQATFPPPTGAQVVRALRAPAVAYAWLLLGAVVAMVLIVVAANVGSTGADTGVESDDTNAIGVLLGMPFQIAGMALLGSIGFDEDGIRASLFFPPLLLTGLYLVMVVRTAKRSEVIPFAGTRALLAVIVGFAAAAVVTPLTWALAMRADGSTVHAASANLFFGLWALTGIAFFVGASRAAGAVRPAWFTAEYAAAAKIWLGSVACWLAASGLVLIVVAAVKTDIWVAILAPLWVVTTGLDTYAVAHLGSLSLMGDSARVEDLSAPWTIALIVGAIVLAVLTAVAWHLRRRATPEALGQPASWVVLPVTYAVGGLLVWLVPSVAVGGGFGDIGASAVLQPAFWTTFVLAVWGVAVEAGSRYVAPSIAPSLPSRLQSFLRGPEPTVVPEAHPALASDATPPRPLSPEERARYKRLGLAVGALAVLGLGAWITVSVVNSKLYSPEAQAEAYLDAVVAADLDKALDLAPTDSDLGDDSLLTSEVYKAAETRITGYEIGEVEEDGDQVSVSVELKGLDGSTDTEITLAKDGTTKGVFDNWKVTDGGLAKSVGIYLPDAAGDLTVNGVAVDRVDDSVWLLPGDYVIDAYAGNEWLESSAEPVSVLADEDFQYLDVPTATASDAFVSEVEAQIDDYLAGCMASTELEPDDCPNSAYGYGDVRNVVWTLDQAPTADFEYFDGTFPADLSYGESGTATVTYEVDESYGYGKPDWQPDSETTDIYLSSIKVDEQGGALVVSFDD